MPLFLGVFQCISNGALDIRTVDISNEVLLVINHRQLSDMELGQFGCRFNERVIFTHGDDFFGHEFTDRMFGKLNRSFGKEISRFKTGQMLVALEVIRDYVLNDIPR